MRKFITAILTAVFVTGFFVYFALYAPLSLMRNGDAVREIASAASLREHVVEFTTETIHAEVRRDQRLRTVSKSALANMVGSVISEDWFDTTLRQVHTELIAAWDGIAQAPIVDLRQLKDRMHERVKVLSERSDAVCAQLLGAAACADRSRAAGAADAFRRHLDGAVSRLPQEIDLAGVLDGGNGGDRGDRGRALAWMRDGLEDEFVRRHMVEFTWFRWGGLGILALVLMLIAALNRRPGARLCRAVGGALFMASAVYLCVAHGIAWIGEDVVREQLAEVRAQQSAQLPPEVANDARAVIAARGAEAVIAAALPRVLMAPQGQVWIFGIAGIVLLVCAMALKREP